MKNKEIHSEILKELKSVRDFVRYCTSKFYENEIFLGHGNTEYIDEAIQLVYSALHLKPVDIDIFLDALVTEDEKTKILDYLNKRIVDRMPLPYITGSAWLQGLEFIVNSDVLIPRSFIAELLSQDLFEQDILNTEPSKILDMCTGSGCLGILVALIYPFAEVDGVDISDAAIKIAKLNKDKHNVQNFHPIVSDLFSFNPDYKYDLIICNPPYVNSVSMQNLPPEYGYEPQLALAGGEKGMDTIKRFLTEALNFTYDNTSIILEIGNEYEYFVKAFPNLHHICLETATTTESVVFIKGRDLHDSSKLSKFKTWQ